MTGAPRAGGRPGGAGPRAESPGAPAIRAAASVIVLRDGPQGPRLLMGQRGEGAPFMPSKYVFPGGALDPQDAALPLGGPLPGPCAARLACESAIAPAALAACALRELAEETGLLAGRPAPVPSPLPAYARAGLAPDAGALRFVFRAITPQGRPRRFDARFFLLPAAALAGDPDDLAGADDELGHLHWVSLAQARALALPFITEVVLAEIGALVARGLEADPDGVPFFDNSGPAPRFRRLL